MKKFRFSVDDCIEFLRDLSCHGYKSIFDNEFLGFLRGVHEKTGAVFCLNLFYENCASTGFEPEKPKFCLKDMTDRYKGEFTANSDWLKLSFHSRAEFPAPPYKSSGYDEVYRDCKAVNAEIVRFAGENSLTDEITVHCGLTTLEGFKALTDCGYRVFYGYLKLNAEGNPSVAYYFDREFLIAHENDRSFYDRGYLFKKTDILLNAYCDEHEAVRDLKKLLDKREEFYELMFHEQYFYPDYVNYIPRYREIIESAAETMADAGYNGGYLTE